MLTIYIPASLFIVSFYLLYSNNYFSYLQKDEEMVQVVYMV